MERFFDTVVIGAGPAGAACGITLLRQNMNSCVIDKAVFPRHKTCAGLVTAKTYALIGELLKEEPPEALFSDTATEVRLYERANLLTEAKLDRPVRLVSRSHFDNALADVYRTLGGTLYEGERGVKTDYENKSVTLNNGDILRYKNLVFADGALSMSRRFTGIKNSDLAFGIEAYIPSELLPIDSVNLYFSYLSSGYVWAFPHGDTVCVGAADQYKKGESYREILDTFLRDMGVEPADVNYIGAFLPYGKAADQSLLPQDVIAIGDAAGLTDPISGEGLYMALASGIQAAKAAQEEQIRPAYLKSIEPLLQTVKEGRKAQHTFYAPLFHRIFLSRVKGNSRVVNFFFENMVQEYRYSYNNMQSLYRDYKKTKGKT